MIYLSEFYFPSQNSEANYLAESPRAKMTCYDSFYPFGLFAGRGLKALDLADVTILYGGNGSGKTTALNVMADALRLQRGAQYNRSDFFPDYVSLCQFHTLHAIPAGSLILTSDDVFDYMLDVRAINDNIDTRRGSLFDEYTEARTAKFQMHSMEDYDRLKQVSAARRYSKSQVARKTLSPNIRTHSNGESAFLMFQEKLRGDALCRIKLISLLIGKQPFRRAADRFGGFFGRFGPVLRLPVCAGHPFAVFAGNPRCPHL